MHERSIVPLEPPRLIECDATPEDVLARWPAEEPLAVLYSGRGPADQARWTVVARPSETLRVRPGEDWELRCGFLRREVRKMPQPPIASGGGPMFGGGWIGWMSYDLGREIEPRAQLVRGGSLRDRDWAVMEWQRCDHALVHDRATDNWWVVGSGWERVWREVTKAARAPLNQSADDSSAMTRGKDARSSPPLFSAGGGRLGTLTATPAEGLVVHPSPLEAGPEDAARRRYIAACERALEYIRAGDVYQVNLAHRITHNFEGSSRATFRRLLSIASPWFGAYLEGTEGGERHAVCSVSPELLFRIERGTGRIITRPMKGTHAPGAGAAEALRASAKDRAELNMIVDLMRNDLGRVCEVGSVRVERGREVEWHGAESGKWNAERGDKEVGDHGSEFGAGGVGGILQATATVGGVVRNGLTIADVIRAVVPGGSVTGAPKIRAMQIIDELEPVRRGPYCGTVGFVGDDGTCAMNVGIRTALISGHADPSSRACDAIVDGVMDYSVGAGIVADSVADAEWLETLQKAGVLRAMGTT